MEAGNGWMEGISVGGNDLAMSYLKFVDDAFSVVVCFLIYRLLNYPP